MNTISEKITSLTVYLWGGVWRKVTFTVAPFATFVSCLQPPCSRSGNTFMNNMPELKCDGMYNIKHLTNITVFHMVAYLHVYGRSKKRRHPIRPMSALNKTKRKNGQNLSEINSTIRTNQNCATEALKQHLASWGQYATHSAWNQVTLDSNLNFWSVVPQSHSSLFPKRIFKTRYFISISDCGETCPFRFCLWNHLKPTNNFMPCN